MFVISLWSFHFLLRLSVYFQDPQSSFCSTSTSWVGRGISAGSSALILPSFGAAERQNLGFNLIRFTLNVILKHNEQKLVQLQKHVPVWFDFVWNYRVIFYLLSAQRK